MPIYEYKGQRYDVATDDVNVAKEKILNYLGKGEAPAAPPADTAPAPAPITAKDKERTWGEVFTDPLAAVAQSFGKVLSTPSDIQSIIRGERPEKAKGTPEALLERVLPFGMKPSVSGVLEKITPSKEAPGERLESALKGVTTDITEPIAPLGRELAATAEAAKSRGLVAREKELQQKLAEEESFLGEAGTAIGTTLTDPALLTTFIGQQIPMLMGPLAGGALTQTVARSLLLNAAEKTISRIGVSGAVATGAAMQGADVGADVYKSVFDGLVAKGTSEEEAHAIAIDKAQKATAQAAALSIASNFIPGGAALEKSFLGRIAGKEAADAVKRGVGQRLGSVAGKVTGETLQESIEEGGGKLLGNIQVAQALPETDIYKGVGAATGLGALGGVMFGGLASIPSVSAAEKVAKAPPPPPGTKYAFDANGTLRLVEENTGKDVRTGEQIGTMPTKQGELFTLEEAPYQVTPGDINMQAQARQEASDRAQEQIDLLKQRLATTTNPQEAATIRDDISKLELQVQETGQQKAVRLGDEIVTLQRKRVALEQQRASLEEARDAEKSLDGKKAITEQINGIDTQIDGISTRQEEILKEGRKLEKEGVTFDKTKDELDLKGPSPIVNKKVLAKFGLAPKAPIRQELMNLDMTDPADRQTFIDAVDKHTIRKAKINMEEVEKYLSAFETTEGAPSGTTVQSNLGVEPGAGDTGVSVPSGELQSTEAVTAPTAAGLAGNIPATGGPLAGEGVSGETQQDTLAPKMQGELLGKSTITLADRITQGDLRGALEDIANSPQYTALDNLVAKRLLQSKTLPKVEVVSPEVTGGFPAQYDPNTDTVQIAEGNIDSHTVLHETVHGFLHVMIRTSEAREARGLGSNPKLKSLQDVYAFVKKNRPDLVEKYGMKDLSEFASEAMSNPDFQNDLRNTPYRTTNVFTEFARAVLRAMGINVNQSGVADIDALAGALMAVEGALSTGRQMQEGVQAGVRQQIEPEIAKVQRTQEAKDMDDAYNKSNPQKAPPKTPWSQKFFGAWSRSYHSNNSLWATLFGPGQNILSFDEAFSNRMYGQMMKLAKEGNVTMDQARLALMRLNISQSLFRDMLAKRYVEQGEINYDAATNTWSVSDDPVNMKAFSDQIRKLADRIGESTEWVLERVSRAYEAQRIMGMYSDLNTTKSNITRTEKDIQTLQTNRKRTKQEDKQLAKKRDLLKELKEEKEYYEALTQHMTMAEAQQAMRILSQFPEAKAAFDIWNTMRERTIKKLVEAGVTSKKKAERWLDERAYVPFSREMGEEEFSGYRMSARGIREKMTEPGIKGSQRVVKNTAGNMVQWMEWSIARAISNKQIKVMLDQYKAVLPNEVREGRGDPGNTFSVFEDGIQKFYHVADPMIAQAFTGMETVGFGMLGIASKFKRAFSHMITRIPIFPVAQLIIMDTWVAMHTTGLKRPFGLLKEVAKEAVKTISGSNQLTRQLLKSDARDYLKARGVIATQDYQELANTDVDAADVLGLATPSTFEKFKNIALMKKLWVKLDQFAAATDNVLRQAIYSEAKKEGLSDLEAQQMATEFANFRRSSGSPSLQAAARVIPFFNAYSQILRVTAQTLAGSGITPKQRSEGYKVLGSVAAKLAVFSVLYAALVGGDDDYWDKNRKVRDRVFVIPFTGGYSIPIRQDVFSIPKIVAEYGFNLLFRPDRVDRKMFSDAIKTALLNTVTPPSQTIITPTVGVIANRDFFHDRDIVNPTLEKLEAEFQYTKNTSELSKAIGSTLKISPAKLDYWLQGMLGSVMTLTAVATNDLIAGARGIPRPAKSTKDMLASLPSMGGFVSKDDTSNALTDFYEAARDVNKVNATLENIAKRDIDAARAKLKEEDNLQKRMAKEQVAEMQKALQNISRYEKHIYESKTMSSEQKAAELKRLNEIRERLAKPSLELRKRIGY